MLWLRITLFCVSWLGLIVLPGFPAVVWGQDPVITELSPRGLLPAQTTTVRVGGQHLQGVLQLVGSQSWLSERVTDAPADGQQFCERITLPPEATPGLVTMRVLTDHGVSSAALVLIDDLPTILKVGGNQQPGQAQRVLDRAAVEGTVAPLTRDYYLLPVQAGQQLTLEVWARRLGSPLDPCLRVFSSDGAELAYSDDQPGLGGDAQLSTTFSQSGEVLIEVRDVKYGGGFYRLRIGDFPAISTVDPSGVSRTVEESLSLVGPGTVNTVPATLPLTARQGDWGRVTAARYPGGPVAMGVVELLDHPVVPEVEPNDQAGQGTRFSVGDHIVGRFSQRGDVDRFVVSGKKDELITFTGRTRTEGSTADLLLKLLGPAGNVLVSLDDDGLLESRFHFRFPEEGDYTLLVSELTGHSGSGAVYGIASRTGSVAFHVTSTIDTLNVPPGGTAAVVLTGNRSNGFAGPIEIGVNHLPANWVASRTVIGAGRNTAVLTITAPDDALPVPYPEQELIASGVAEGVPLVEKCTVSEAWRPKLNQPRYVPRQFSTRLGLGRGAATPVRLVGPPPELVVVRPAEGQPAAVGQWVLTAVRQAEWQEPITLAMLPEQDPLPAGVTVALKPIEANQSTITLEVSVAPNTAPGDYTLGLMGTIKHGEVTLSTAAPALRLTISQP